MSRIYVGFHFRHSVEDGLTMGRRIGQHIVQEKLAPLEVVRVHDDTPSRG